ncbi:unnamed protein product [Mucor fragilis]
MKEQALTSGTLALRGSQARQSSISFPRQLKRFTGSDCMYIKQESVYRMNLLESVLPGQKQQIENQLRRIGSKFVECVIMSQDKWILITQLDVFISNSYLDNYTYPIKDLDPATFSINVVHKQEQGASWNELIIQNGPYQLLVLGGIVGSHATSDFTPFLGPSFPYASKMFGDTLSCYTRVHPADITQTYRYLRDYGKCDANLKASFISRRFFHDRFSAVHPLFFGEFKRASSLPPFSLLGSYVLASYISANTTKEEFEKYFALANKNKKVAGMVGRKIVVSMEQLYNQHEEEIKKTGMLTQAVLGKLLLMEAATDMKSPINMQVVDDDSGPKLRDIMNNGLGDAIRNANKVRVKAFKEKYL